jgi:porphobilinogen synthase
MTTAHPFTTVAGFPRTRPRRLRQFPWSRALVSEHRLHPADLVWPVFLKDTPGAEPVPSMPGVFRYGPDVLLEEVGRAYALGIPAVALFPRTPAALKDDTGREAFNPGNLVNTATRAIKAAQPGLGVIADVALDPYTSHGHDGLMRTSRRGEPIIANDETVEALVNQALTQAAAGCDVIAPSDMMDGRIGAIREALDDRGYDDVLILAYAAKYASGWYGPFREAVGSAQNLGGAGKDTYQMDPANTDEALRETALDIAEGADMVMVKPALAYLDIVRRVKDTFGMPTACYSVSGEYAAVKAAAANGWLDGDRVMAELLLSMKRAGADFILTYAARDVAEKLK